MPEEHDVALLPLLIVAVLSFAVPLVLRRIRSVRIPIAVGEILAGMVVGKSGFNLVQVDSTLQLLNFLGLASLMFVSGLEIDFAALAGRAQANGRRSLRERLYHPLGLGILFLTLTLAGAWFVSVRLAGRGFVSSAPLLALVMSTAALSMAVPVLKESGLMATMFGQTLLTATVIGDFVSMVAITVGVSLYSGGFSLQTLLVLGLLAALLLAYRAGRAVMRLRLWEGLGGGTAQIGVRASFAAMLVFVALAQGLGVEVVLGAFLAGVLMALLSGPAREDVSHKLDALGFGFLIPIFFLMVGITFDFRVLLADPQAMLFVPLLLAATLLVRGLPPALVFLIWHKPRQALAGGALMAAQMSVTIAASEVVLRSGAISPSIHAAIVLVVILLAVLAPVLFGKLMPPPPAAEQSPVLIAGATPAAIRLARRVARTAPVLLADADPGKVGDARASGLAAVEADVTDPVALQKALGKDVPRAVVAMTGNDKVNLAAARQARAVLGAEQVLVFVATPALWAEARSEGLQAINPELAALDLAQNLLVSPAAADLLSDDPDSIGLFDVVLHNPAYSGHRLRDLQLPAAVLIAAVHRSGEKLIPHGDTVLATGDLLTVVGPAAERDDILARFA